MLNMTAGRPDYTLDKVLTHLSLDAHHRVVGSVQFDAEHLGCRGLDIGEDNLFGIIEWRDLVLLVEVSLGKWTVAGNVLRA